MTSDLLSYIIDLSEGGGPWNRFCESVSLSAHPSEIISQNCIEAFLHILHLLTSWYL